MIDISDYKFKDNRKLVEGGTLEDKIIWHSLGGWLHFVLNQRFFFKKNMFFFCVNRVSSVRNCRD
jgi:hypothetical protein